MKDSRLILIVRDDIVMDIVMDEDSSMWMTQNLLILDRRKEVKNCIFRKERPRQMFP